MLEGEAISRATLSIAVVSDRAIRPLNRRYLQHDYATDVLSFLLDSGPGWLDGEIIVSADTAASQAPQYDSSAEAELLLYVIHGALHLVGYDDTTPAERKRMLSSPASLSAAFAVGTMTHRKDLGNRAASRGLQRNQLRRNPFYGTVRENRRSGKRRETSEKSLRLCS